MGDSEILRLLKAEPVKGLEIVVLEKVEPIGLVAGQNVSYELQYASECFSAPQNQFLCSVGPENVGNGHPVHPKYNLNALVDGPVEVGLPVSQQLKVLHLALERIAELDPRIKGDDVDPVAQIEKIGGAYFDICFMRDFYAFVHKEIADRGL